MITEFSRGRKLATCYVCQRKPQQTELSDRGQLMSRYINFMNLHPHRELAATQVLNGSCRQKRMLLCWNKWRGENGVKTTPLRCINLHLFIPFLFLSLLISSRENRVHRMWRGFFFCFFLFVDKSIQNHNSQIKENLCSYHTMQMTLFIVSFIRHSCHGSLLPLKMI